MDPSQTPTNQPTSMCVYDDHKYPESQWSWGMHAL
jgi:hypothetical protein